VLGLTPEFQPPTATLPMGSPAPVGTGAGRELRGFLHPFPGLCAWQASARHCAFASGLHFARVEA